jgi:hypothetical protein
VPSSHPEENRRKSKKKSQGERKKEPDKKKEEKKKEKREKKKKRKELLAAERHLTERARRVQLETRKSCLPYCGAQACKAEQLATARVV